MAKLLNGKPLFQFTSEIALKSKYLTDLILSSDDNQIISVAESLGVKAPFIRPTALAEDQTPTIDVIIHAMEKI